MRATCRTASVRQLEVRGNGPMYGLLLTLAIMDVVVGLIFLGLFIPLVQHKVGRNALYGFRTPRTLASDEAWFAVNYGAVKAGSPSGYIRLLANDPSNKTGHSCDDGNSVLLELSSMRSDTVTSKRRLSSNDRQIRVKLETEDDGRTFSLASISSTGLLGDKLSSFQSANSSG
jgi:hypothetical protein